MCTGRQSLMWQWNWRRLTTVFRHCIVGTLYNVYLAKNYFSFKLTDILNDDCSDLMLSLMGLGISGNSAALGNGFCSTVTNIFYYCHAFYVFNVHARYNYAIVCPSVCLSSVCNVRALYPGDWNFRQCFYAIWYSGHLWPFDKNFTGIVPGEPLHRRVKPKRGSQI